MPEVQACDFGRDRCQNSVDVIGQARQKCSFCRLAPDNEDLPSHYWKANDIRWKVGGHPLLNREKVEARFQRAKNHQTKKLAVDRGKRKLLKKAARAEQTTERNIIHATKNSGRSNRDGDHIAAGSITLDTKLQTTREHPVVILGELEKVREDAKRAGNPIGALVLRNRNGVGVVVMAEADFALILQRLDNGS